MGNALEMLKGWDPPRVLALINRLGGQEAAEAVLRGDLTVTEATRPFFDNTGRRIPPRGMKGMVDANPAFRLEQPMMGTADYAARLARIKKYLGEVPIDEFEFQRRVGAVLERIKDDKRMANLVKCPHFPFALPRMEVSDYGKALDEQRLPAVGRAYETQFSGRKFYNHWQGTLAGQVTVVEGSRHGRFIEALGKGPVVGVYFPCLQGFSIEADLQQMADLPDCMILAGAIETAAVQIMYPDVVAANYDTPGMDCAALRWRGDALCFKADDDRLHFGSRDLRARDDCSGGLSFFG